MKKVILMSAGALVAVLLVRSFTPSGSESAMLEWAQALNFHLASGGPTGSYSFPEELREIDPELRADLSTVDSWGNRFKYRRLRDDLYQLISVGADGVYGNADDIIVQNGAFYPAETIYAQNPP